VNIILPINRPGSFFEESIIGKFYPILYANESDFKLYHQYIIIQII